ncbi:MAG TPA: XRE family transcriptional regulator [Mizugakiibacter sp.]|nr:XRE family transcriptional regulator [Mizugakiibacter sp.]
MFSITEKESKSVIALGERLRIRRIDRGDTQAKFAARLGVSIPTYQRMERGDPGVALGHWVRALRLLGGLEAFDGLFPVPLLCSARNRRRAPRQGGGRT